MDLELNGKRALVTGASKGIGLAVARRLIAEGAAVVGGSRESSADFDLLREQGEATHFRVDLTKQDGPLTFVENALRDGPLDILINNAGAVSPRLKGFASVTDEQWSATMDLTFMAAVRTTRAVLPHMIDRGSGSIVNNVSVNATLPDPVVIDYSAAKAALLNFSKALSKEVGPSGSGLTPSAPDPCQLDSGWVPEESPLRSRRPRVPVRMTWRMKP